MVINQLSTDYGRVPHGEVPPLPPKVAGAIAKVMFQVPKLAKTERNIHGNYNFAGIDDFLEAVRPLCADAGLIILQDEVFHEVIEGGLDKFGKPRRFLSVTFGFTLAHESGETWGHRPTRTIMVDTTMGSQAFGAAQSYTLKLFMRSLFQIATGEKGQDVDEHAAVPLHSEKPARKSSAGAKRDGDWERFQRALSDTQNEREVERLREEYRASVYPTWSVSGSHIGPGSWQEMAEADFEERIASFRTVAAEPPAASAWKGSILVEMIQKTSNKEELIGLKSDPEYIKIFDQLTKPDQLKVRKMGATKLDTLNRTLTSGINGGTAA